jgi:hypothetical protein
MSRTLSEALVGAELAKAGEILPFRGEMCVLWGGFVYPFRTQDSAMDFLDQLRSDRWSEVSLNDFERYPASRPDVKAALRRLS